MQHVEAMEFFDRVVGDDEDDSPRTVTLEHQSGAALEVELRPVDRKEVLDEIKRLPDAMLEVMAGAEDAEEAQEQAQEENMLSGVDGNVITAFENLCTKGISHPELTEHNIELMVEEFDFPVLFTLGAQIMEITFEGSGSVKDFHEPGSDKSY